MNFLKRKQIIVLSLVLMLLVAGYLQYNYNKSSQYSEDDSAQIGDAVYVDNQDASDKENIDTAAAGDEEKTATASKEANTFFAQAKMDRDVTRDKDIETMKSIYQDDMASKDAKSKAYEKMMKIVETSQKETNIETLIKEKGFNDVVALFSDDGSVDVVVKAPAISKADWAKIADIVSRQGNVPFDKIVIKNMF
ncbi:SpoIIIAH-like family protein [Ruminiclostridium josui]|uniref:SpoIIIAH-like family protein n=1 Tax=Ruminiclostridium josui TaxID=1499 RepID=UPI0004649933|nr:SpoIIIAH-like family protein [Ruminiclostridium josui]